MIYFRHGLDEWIHLDDAGSATFVRCLTRVSLSTLSTSHCVRCGRQRFTQGSRIRANQVARNGAACTFFSTITAFLVLDGRQHHDAIIIRAANR